VARGTVNSDGPWLRGVAVLDRGRRLSIEGGTFIGNNPYHIDDSYGPKVVVPGLIGGILTAASLANKFLGPPAYGQYLNSQRANINARLDYSQSSQGTLIQQVEVENRSGEPVRVSVQVEGSRGTMSQFQSQWVLSGRRLGVLPLYPTSSHPERLPTFLQPGERAKVEVWVVAGFNDPPLLRAIEFDIPSGGTASEPSANGH